MDSSIPLGPPSPPAVRRLSLPVFSEGSSVRRNPPLSTPNERSLVHTARPVQGQVQDQQCADNTGLDGDLPSHAGIDDEQAEVIFDQNQRAVRACEHEKNMSFGYTVSHYRRAMLWAILMASPIILEGYETALMPNFFSYTPFRQHFGRWREPDSPGNPARGLGWVFFALFVEIFSVFAGHRLAVYLAAEALLGVAWGLFQGITLPYVCDISPLALKGPASTLLNIFWLLGQIVCSGVLRGALEIGDSMWQIRIPMLWQYTWLWLLILIVCLAPESPMWLIRNKRRKDAGKVLSRLNRDPHFDETGHVAMLHAIDEHEKAKSTSMGFRACLTKHNLRRTEIAVVVYATQQLVGSPLVSYSVKMLDKGGLGATHAYEYNMAMWTWCICITLASIYASRKLGRRTMWLGGLVTSCTLHSLSGFLALFPDTSSGIVSYIIAVLLIFFATAYNFTIGPVGYAIIGEVPQTRLKTATNSLARAAFIVVNVVNLFLVPKLLEDKPWGWGVGARSSLLYACTTAGCIAWSWYRLPETKGLTPAQIDHMFEKFQHSRKSVVDQPAGKFSSLFKGRS